MAKIAKPEGESTIRFSSKLQRPASKATWAILTLPKSVSAKLPSSGQEGTIMVEGVINGFPFRAAVDLASPNSNGNIRLSKALQDAAGGSDDDTVTLEITRIGEESECRMPMDLRKAFDAAPSMQASGLWAQWADITPMARRDWILWITSAKQEETRERRIENACDMLASGKRRPCCMPGINWRTKDSDIISDETWQPLAGKSRAAKTTK